MSAPPQERPGEGGRAPAGMVHHQPSPMPFYPPMYPPTPPPPPGYPRPSSDSNGSHRYSPEKIVAGEGPIFGAGPGGYLPPVATSVDGGNDAPASDTDKAAAAAAAAAAHMPVHNKTTEFRLLSTARPHMRAFHYSWLSCAICFFSWFAIAPLLASVRKPRCADPLSEICTVTCAITPFRNSTFLGQDPECRVCFPRDKDYGCGGLGFTEDQIFTSNAIGVAGTAGLRLFGGPIIDLIGAKWFNVAIMVFSLWSLYWLAFANSYEEFVTARFFVSFLGASFVGTSAWCSLHFDKSIVGLVGATASGWGKVGAGIAYLVIPAIYRSLKVDHDNEYAWRRTLLIPPSVMVLVAICTHFFSDNSPDDEKFVGSKKDEEAKAITGHTKNKVSLHVAFGAAAMNYRTWVMGLLFFASNGVDIAMGSTVAYYFVKEFGMSQSEASLAGSSFGLMNLFARSVGGLLSDKLYIRMGLFGRVIATFLCTIGMGIGLVVFTSITNTNGGLLIAILVLMITSIFTQVGGGNLGAISMNLLMAIGFRDAWTIVGYSSIFIGFTVFFVAIPDARSRKIIKDSLRKHGGRLYRGISSTRSESGSDNERFSEVLPAMVMILAKKEDELSAKDRIIESLQRRLAQFHNPFSSGGGHAYKNLPMQPSVQPLQPRLSHTYHRM